MPEEKKIKLNRESLTQHGDEITTTQHTSPDVTQEVKQHWRFKDDGTENTPLVKQYNADKQRIDSQFHVDPNTGEVDGDKFLFETFGIKPEDMRRKREAEMALNRRKQKESALYNALAVIGDMFTTAGGGNVWQRQPNNKAKEAADRNLALEHEQRAEDAQNHQLVSNAKKAYAAEVAKLNDAYQKAFGSTRKVTQKGNTVTTKQRGDDVTTGYIEQQVYPQRDGDNSRSSSSKSGSGSWKNNGTYQIGLVHNGQLKYRDINGQQAKNIVEHAKTLYEKALKNGDAATKKAILDLLGSNIVQEDVSKPGHYDWDDEALLRSGYIFDADKGFRNGLLQGADKTIRDYYREITGDQTDYSELADYDLVTPAMRAIQETQKKPATSGRIDPQTGKPKKQTTYYSNYGTR